MARIAALDKIKSFVSSEFNNFHLRDNQLRDYMLSVERKCREFVANHAA